MLDDPWTVEMFLSGSTIVRDSSESRNTGPWLSIHGPGEKADAKWDENRFTFAGAIREFLNGGDRPACLSDMERINDEELLGVDGSRISAVGPMIDADPPKCLWRQDDSWDAIQSRVKLVDLLMAQ